MHGTLQSAVNGKKVGLNETGPEMQFHFGELIAHLAKTRNVRAGSIVGSGTVSNQDAAKGFGCIVERRAVEAVELGAPATPYLAIGDTVRLEVHGRDGLSVFGAIVQRVTGPRAETPTDPDTGADDTPPPSPNIASKSTSSSMPNKARRRQAFSSSRTASLRLLL